MPWRAPAVLAVPLSVWQERCRSSVTGYGGVARSHGRDELTNGREMARGFFGVDFVQARVHRRRRAGVMPAPFFFADRLLVRQDHGGLRVRRRRRLRRTTDRRCGRGRGGAADARRRSCWPVDDARDVHFRRAAGFELLDQLRHRRHGFAQQRHHVGRAIQRLVDDAIEQVFDRPRELADELRADHAAAALQRVEGAAHVDQRVLVLRILVPQREQPLELGDLVLGFLDEQLEEFRIDLAVDRLRRRRGRDRRGAAAAGWRTHLSQDPAPRWARARSARNCLGLDVDSGSMTTVRAWSVDVRRRLRRAGWAAFRRGTAGKSRRCPACTTGRCGRPAASPCSTRPRRWRRRAGRPLPAAASCRRCARTGRARGRCLP